MYIVKCTVYIHSVSVRQSGGVLYLMIIYFIYFMAQVTSSEIRDHYDSQYGTTLLYGLSERRKKIMNFSLKIFQTLFEIQNLAISIAVILIFRCLNNLLLLLVCFGMFCSKTCDAQPLSHYSHYIPKCHIIINILLNSSVLSLRVNIRPRSLMYGPRSDLVLSQ